MSLNPKLHHYCQNITQGHLDDVVEMYKLLDFDVVFEPPKDTGPNPQYPHWIMVGQKDLRFAIQITQVVDVPIADIEIKKRTHIAFLSDDPQGVLDKVKVWAESKGIVYREGGWSNIERWFDLPDIFNNFVVEVMHTSIEG